MEIKWGPRDQFGVRLITLLGPHRGLHGVLKPVRRLRLEQRDARHGELWRPTFTLYDDVSGELVGHYANIELVDAAIDHLIAVHEGV